MSFISAREAKKKLGVCTETLRNWANAGKIPYIRSAGNKRLYDADAYIREHLRSSLDSRTVCYCRVSSKKQKDDLQRQIAYMQDLYPQAEIVQDIGSGLNFKRPGLNSLLERVSRRDIDTIVVAHKDRLMRFGFDLFQRLCDLFGTKLLVLSETKHSPEQELVGDMLAIIQVFGCRVNGLRKYSSKIKEDKDIPDRDAENFIEDVDGNGSVVLQ